MSYDEKGRVIAEQPAKSKPHPTVPELPPYRTDSQAAVIGYLFLFLGIILLITVPIVGAVLSAIGINILLYSHLYDRITDVDNRLAETNRLLEQQNHISTSLALYLRDIRDGQAPPSQPDPHSPENFPT